MTKFSKEQKVTRELIRQHLFDNIFRLQSEDYGANYPNWPGLVGIEAESILFDQESASDTRQTPKMIGESKGISRLLIALSKENDWTYETILLSDASEVVFKIHLGENDFLTLEPGGQLEFSSRPYPCYSEAVKRLHEVNSILDHFFLKNGVDLVRVGINPWNSVNEVGLQLPKDRYTAMNQYFQSIGEFGQKMMRLTCTVQVNLDFGCSEETLSRRVLLSNLIAPFVTATFANSPIYRGSPSGYKSYRSFIWQNTDQTRTGYWDMEEIASRMTKDSVVDSYAKYVESANVIFVEKLNFQVPAKPTTFRTWVETGIDGVFPNFLDLETHLSLLFPEVRPRGFLELRSVDGQPTRFQTVPGAYYLGLLYDSKSLDKALEITSPYLGQVATLWKKSSYGLDDKEVREVSSKLFELAIAGFDRLPTCFRGECVEETLEAYYAELTSQGKTPADLMLSSIENSCAILSLSDIHDINKRGSCAVQN